MNYIENVLGCMCYNQGNFLKRLINEYIVQANWAGNFFSGSAKLCLKVFVVHKLFNLFYIIQGDHANVCIKGPSVIFRKYSVTHDLLRSVNLQINQITSNK